MCGLLASIELASRSVAVTLVERLPAAGGQEPEGAETDALAESARAAGVTFLFGTLAIEWSEGALTALGVDGADELRSDVLVIATGTRPATRAELAIDGDRCAGVLPGSAALHITESGVLLGHRPVVVGGGSLAATLVHAVRSSGAQHVTVVAPDGVLDPRVRDADSVIENWDIVAATGDPRLQSVALSDAQGGRERLRTDALILAHRRVPMRNVEGAIGAAGSVVFCQSSAEPKSRLDAESAVTAALAQVLSPDRMTKE
jgi:NADPH-dependent 2,4-dienoyl-CoA reductase/sulfur reductase-like enzyme